MDSTCDNICVGNGLFFYFNDDGKIDIYVLVKEEIPCSKTNSSVIFIECTEINWKTPDINGLCITIFLDKMEWFLVVLGKLHNDECLMYIFTANI